MEGSWKNSELSLEPMLIKDPTSVGDKANFCNNVVNKINIYQRRKNTSEDRERERESKRTKPVSFPSRTYAHQ